jgi:hypothetical protein
MSKRGYTRGSVELALDAHTATGLIRGWRRGEHEWLVDLSNGQTQPVKTLQGLYLMVLGLASASQAVGTTPARPASMLRQPGTAQVNGQWTALPRLTDLTMASGEKLCMAAGGGGYLCTRAEHGNRGIHMAGDGQRIVALWDGTGTEEEVRQTCEECPID